MYSLKDDGVVEEVTCGNNFEYILQDNTYFVSTDYKILQSRQADGIFVKCMKMVKNGKVDLYYVTEDYRPMSVMFKSIEIDTLITIVINLFASIIEVRDNGFLTCECIDMSWDKMFVDNNTLKVRLVYIPVSVRVFNNYVAFESELRSCIVNLISKVITTPTERLEMFVADLRNGSMTLDAVYNKAKSGGNVISAPPLQKQGEGVQPGASQPEPVQPEPHVFAVPLIKLVAMNAPQHCEILIDKDSVLIGKKQEIVDKAITFNNMISRKHCRITRTNGGFCINDEGSVNGTFLNGLRLAVGQKYPINRGDVIRLANSDFQVV